MQEFCQSCGIPLTTDICSTEANGRLSENYCRDCYVNGNFTNPNMTLGEMIAYWVPSFLDKGYSEIEAREFMEPLFPELLRWRQADSPDKPGNAENETSPAQMPILRAISTPRPAIPAKSPAHGNIKASEKHISPVIYKPFKPFVIEVPDKPELNAKYPEPAGLPEEFPDTLEDNYCISYPDSASDQPVFETPPPELNLPPPSAADGDWDVLYNFVEPGIPPEMLSEYEKAAGETAQVVAPGETEDTSAEAEDSSRTGIEKQPIGRRLVAYMGTMLIVASILTVLSPFWISYYDRFNPFSNVEEKPDLPIMQIDENSQDQSYPRLPAGSTGVLDIPRFGLNLNVAYGIEPEVLEQSPGFYPQSGLPEKGNVSIAGHRNMAGSPFMNLNEMAKGDVITLSYQGKLYSYAVDSVFITNDRDWSVIEPTPVPALTLTTCDPVIRPANGKYDRLIVRAYLKSTKNSNS